MTHILRSGLNQECNVACHGKQSSNSTIFKSLDWMSPSLLLVLMEMRIPSNEHVAMPTSMER